MTESVVVERDLPHPPGRVWRALTLPHLVGEWLMEADFRPEPGHEFEMRADWGSIACRVLAVEPERRLSYSWDAHALRSTVTWTLTPTEGGTRLRMEQTGFQPGQTQFRQGALAGWPRFLDRLEAVLARPEGGGA